MFLAITKESPSTASHQCKACTQEEIEQIVKTRQTTPNQLVRELQGDLDAIIQKCLALEPENRFTTVGDLCIDLKRFLKQQPVFAKPPTKRYLAKKFVQRHPMRSSLAVIVLILWLLTMVSVNHDQKQIRLQRARAEQEKAATDSLNDYIFEVFAAARENEVRGQAVTPLELLDSAWKTVAGRLRLAVPAEVNLGLAKIYSRWGNPDKANVHLNRVRPQLDPQTTPRLWTEAETINAMLLLNHGQAGQALNHAQAAQQTAQTAYAGEIERRAEVNLTLAGSLWANDSIEKAEELVQQTIALLNREKQPGAKLAECHLYLAAIALQRADFAGAEANLAEVLPLSSRWLEPAALAIRAQLAENRGEPERALTLYQQAQTGLHSSRPCHPLTTQFTRHLLNRHLEKQNPGWRLLVEEAEKTRRNCSLAALGNSQPGVDL